MDSAPDPQDASDSSRAPRWAPAVLAIVALVGLSVWVTSRAAEREPESERDPLELSDPAELRQVVQAISTVIQQTEGAREDEALTALAALRPQSPGAADLRESCLSTYRAPREADRLLREGARLLPADGGAAPPEATARLEEISQRARTLIIEARESLDRCNALYQSGARRLHIEPARRPTPR